MAISHVRAVPSASAFPLPKAFLPLFPMRNSEPLSVPKARPFAPQGLQGWPVVLDTNGAWTPIGNAFASLLPSVTSSFGLQAQATNSSALQITTILKRIAYWGCR